MLKEDLLELMAPSMKLQNHWQRVQELAHHFFGTVDERVCNQSKQATKVDVHEGQPKSQWHGAGHLALDTLRSVITRSCS